MSFSKPKPQKPFNKTIKWKGSDGGSFVYYDGQNNIEIEIDEFIVLDELFSISGWNDDKNKGVWSNEVSDLKREEMAVRIGNDCLLYTSPSPRDKRQSRMPSSA